MLPQKATDDKRAGTFRANVGIDGVMRNERPKRLAAEPRTWWQRVVAGERLPKRLFRHPKCEGTIEDHRMIALDVRELIRKHVFDQPVGSAFHLNLAYTWLRVMRLNSSSLDLQLVTGRIVVVPLVWASCGAMGERIRMECPLCGRRICILYCVDGRVALGQQRGSLIEAADEVEEQLAAGVGKWQVAEFVEDGEVLAGQVIGNPALPTVAALGLLHLLARQMGNVNRDERASLQSSDPETSCR